MTVRIYATDKGTLVTDERGNLLDPSTRQPIGEVIYERNGKKLVPSERAHSQGETVRIHNTSDIRYHQSQLEKPDPGAAFELIGAFPLPVTINNARTLSDEDFERLTAHLASALATYESQRHHIETTYQQHLATLTQQRDTALARLQKPSLEALL